MQTNRSILLTTRLLILVFLFGMACPGFSQSFNAAITGLVKDSANKPVPFASINLVFSKDSTDVQNTTCNAEGKYHLPITKAGTYWLTVSAIGYTTPAAIAIKMEAAQTLRQDILLTKKDRTLEEVKVVSRKPPIQFKADRTVLNVAASINATGYNVFELLAKAPGVRILNGEDILLNGKRGLAVYLDGKLLQLQGREIVDFLQTLSAANIEQIEIITHPSARYDAAGNAGIISIRTRKNANLGINGSATLTGMATYYRPKVEGSANINYRQKKYNLYGSVNYSGGSYRLTTEDTRSLLIKDTGNTFYSQHYVGTFPRAVQRYRAGADFFLSPKSTLGFIADVSTTNWTYDRSSLTDIYQASSKIDSQLVSATVQHKTYYTQNYNLNYLYKDTLGHELSVDAAYGTYRTNAGTRQTNNYVSGPTLLRFNANTNSNDADITIAAAKADYTQMLWKGSLTTGAKGSSVQSDNDLLFYNIFNGNAKPDTGRTNRFVYTEKIAAIYFDYNFTLKKFDFQTGLRLEHTVSSGNLTTILSNTAKAVDTSYTSLFPNLVINYKADKNNSLGLAIGRRINRPAYQNLNPFEFVLDELTYTKGNPFLKPETAYDLKLTHIYKGILSSSVSYSNIQNFQLNYRDTLAGGKTFMSFINAGVQAYWQVTSAVQISPLPWWDVFANAELYQQIVDGKVRNQVLKSRQWSWDITGGSTFRIGKKWSSEITGFYNSRYVDVPAIYHPQWSVDAGVQCKLLKDLGTARFNVTDIFHTLSYNLTRNFGGLYYHSVTRRETRQFRLSFSYKFGNRNVKGTRNRKSSAAEEQGRMG